MDYAIITVVSHKRNVEIRDTAYSPRYIAIIRLITNIDIEMLGTQILEEISK